MLKIFFEFGCVRVSCGDIFLRNVRVAIYGFDGGSSDFHMFLGGVFGCSEILASWLSCARFSSMF